MSEAVKQADAVEQVVDRWVAGFNGHNPDALAAMFAADAIFQGFGPAPLVGREAVADYYKAVPDYRRAEDVRVIHAYRIGEDVVGGFVDITFRDPSGWEARVYLSLVLERSGSDWAIRQYHVSRVSEEH